MDDDEIKMCENISKQIITHVEKLLKVYVGNPKSAEFVKIGADGTPTSYIDIVAENEVIKILKNANFYSYLISEEIGELNTALARYQYWSDKHYDGIVDDLQIHQDVRNNLIDELADVKVVIEQIEIKLHLAKEVKEMMEYKIKRQRERMGIQ